MRRTQMIGLLREVGSMGLSFCETPCRTPEPQAHNRSFPLATNGVQRWSVTWNVSDELVIFYSVIAACD